MPANSPLEIAYVSIRELFQVSWANPGTDTSSFPVNWPSASFQPCQGRNAKRGPGCFQGTEKSNYRGIRPRQFQCANYARERNPSSSLVPHLFGGGGMQANDEGRRVRVPAIRVRTRKWLKTSAESEEGEEETFFPGRLINVPPEIDRFHEYRWQNEKFASDSWCPPGTN